MITVSFKAHRECYREVMQEFRDENPENVVEFDISFESDNDTGIICSKRCVEVYNLNNAFDRPARRKKQTS